MANWRDEIKHLRLDLCDGRRSLLDFRFADDIFIFGTDCHVIGVHLGRLVENLAAVGLQSNTQKTKVLTTQTQLLSQFSSQLQEPNGLIISVVDRESSRKLLGCMLTTAPVQTTTCDVECRLQAAARAFNANRRILCDPKVAIAQKLEYFDRVITPIACFAAGHRTIYRNDLRYMGVAYRRLLRSFVGPPRNMEWALRWHEILHIWNERAWAFTPQIGSKSWSAICLRQTPLAFSTVFRNTAWASLDQDGLSLATTRAHTHWPPKILLGYFDYNFFPLDEFTFMGDRCN